jgi:hypothetical protein
MRPPTGEGCCGFLDRLHQAGAVVAVIERELDDLGEHGLLDHKQRASRATQSLVM